MLDNELQECGETHEARSTLAQRVLFLEVLDLIEEGQEVTPPDGLVYSQHLALASTERADLFVKGPDIT